MFSICMQNLVFPGLLLGEILMFKKYKWKNHLKICHFLNMNYFVTCNVPLDREKIRLCFGLTFDNIFHIVMEISA